MMVILPVLGASMLISSAENPGVVAFRRDFNFSREFVLRTAPKLMGMLLAIPIAIITHSWWALLAGIFAGRLTSAVSSYIMHEHRPRPTLSASKELLSFSGWLFANNLLDFMRWRLSTFIVGKILGNRSVGLFSVSMDLSNLGTTELAAPINRAVFSKYALDKDNPGALARGFLVAAPAIWMLALPISAGIALAAPDFIVVLLGTGWLDGGPILRLMAIAGALHVMSANTAYVYWALGRSRTVASITLAGVAVLIPGTIFGGLRWGLHGVAYAYIAATAIMLPINYGLLMRLIGLRYIDFFARVWRTCAACAAMAIVVYTMSAAWQPTDSLIAVEQLSMIALVGGVVYIGVHWLLWVLTGKREGPEELVVDAWTAFAARFLPSRTLQSCDRRAP